MAEGGPRRSAHGAGARNAQPVGSTDKLKQYVDQLLARSYAFREHEQVLRGNLVDLEERCKGHDREVQQLKRQLSDQAKLNRILKKALTHARNPLAAYELERPDASAPVLSAVQLLFPLPPGDPVPQVQGLAIETHKNNEYGKPSVRARRKLRRLFFSVYTLTACGAIVGAIGTALDIGFLVRGGMCVGVAGVGIVIMIVGVRVLLRITRWVLASAPAASPSSALVTWTGNLFCWFGRLFGSGRR